MSDQKTPAMTDQTKTPRTSNTPRTYSEEEVKARVYEALTIQLLRLRNEVFRGAGIDQDTFDREYLSNLGPYERKLAKREGISLHRNYTPTP